MLQGRKKHLLGFEKRLGSTAVLSRINMEASKVFCYGILAAVDLIQKKFSFRYGLAFYLKSPLYPLSLRFPLFFENYPAKKYRPLMSVDNRMILQIKR